MKSLRIIHLQPMPWILHQPRTDRFRTICTQDFDSLHQILRPQWIFLRSNETNVAAIWGITKHIPIVCFSVRFQQLADDLRGENELVRTVGTPSTTRRVEKLFLLYAGAQPISELRTQAVSF